MKVVLINGSPSQKGCTYTGLSIIKEQLEKNGVAAEIHQVGMKPVSGCIACRKCRETGRCVIENDGVNDVAEAIKDADGVILGSAVHFASATGSATAFFDRLFYSIEKKYLKLKFGAAIVSCRRGGASATFDQLNKYFTITEMPIVSSTYWNQIHGYTPEDVMKDEEGVITLQVLANNMAYLIKCKNQSGVEMPEDVPRVFTNFIR